MILLLLNALVVVPIAAYLWIRKVHPQYAATVTGVGLGLIISPLSLGLYATYFLGPDGILGPVGMVTGIAGLGSLMFHGGPGYYIATALGIVPIRTIVEGAGHLHIHVANALVWALVYGTPGWIIDHYRKRVAL